MKMFLSKFLVCLCLLSASGIVCAERLDEEQARQAAVSFFNNSADRGLRRVKAQQLRLQPAKQKSGCYIFNREDGGTVFVADDDAIGYTVLGYTDGGSFNPDSIPVGLQDWLDQIGVLMDAVHEGKINQRHKLQTRAGSIVVNPLVKSKWNQGKPYNDLTPTIKGVHCVTGCTATATAQVLKYWRWPEYSQGSGVYTLKDGSEKEYSVAIGTKYDWDNMLNAYSAGSYTQQQGQAVAELMRDCGYATHMNYGVEESNAWANPEWLSEVFDYQYVGEFAHDDFSDDAWLSLIREDLDNKRPILYCGYTSDSGHEYVIDGYRSDNYLHVNWGWGGYQDGWFITTDMQGFNNDQRMIYGFEPSRDANSFSYTLKDGVLTITGKGIMPAAYRMERAPWRERCKEIKKIVIGEGITSVVNNFGVYSTDDAYYCFANLEEVSLPEGLTILGENTFVSTAIEQIDLPSSLMLLNYAFWDCSKLKSLRLGPNVMDFSGQDVKYYGTKVEVDAGNPHIMVRDDMLYSKDGTWLKDVLTPSQELVIPEGVKAITGEVLYNRYLVIAKPRQTPKLKGWFSESYLPCVLIAPKDATGYAAWKNSIYPDLKLLYCSDMDKPTLGLDWTFTDGVLSLKGLSTIDNIRNMPYNTARYDIKKIEVGEGIVYLGWYAFGQCYSAKDITLPSTLHCIEGYALPSDVNIITCTATKAPIIVHESLYVDATNGTLRVPTGATGYDAWLKKLPSGWKIEYYNPAPQVAYKLPGDDAEHGACSLDAWESVLKDYPNTVGVLRGDFELLPYLTYNVALADASVQTGYLCPEFKLTDLTSGYKTTDKAPLTGFNPIVSFDVLKGIYKRQLYKGNNSVCLPFDISKAEVPNNCSLYTYSHYDSDNDDAIFTSTQMVDAAQPCYIVAPFDFAWSKSLDECVISAEQPAASGAFCGTFVSTSQFKDRGYAPRTSDNIFAPLADQLHPFRACFILDTPANVRMKLMDGDMTGVSTVRSQQNGDAIYRMDGVRVNGNRQHGIYIVNGKKVIK